MDEIRSLQTTKYHKRIWFSHSLLILKGDTSTRIKPSVARQQCLSATGRTTIQEVAGTSVAIKRIRSVFVSSDRRPS